MANRKEPFTKVIRVDSSVSATINQTKATTYIGIEADTGRYDLQDVNSAKQLVEKYSTVSKPNKSFHTTFLHAGKFLEQFSAKVKRVNKDTVHPGIDSKGNLLYFDKNYNLIEDLTRISITTKEKDLDKSLLLLKVTYSDDSVKYFGNTLITSDVKARYDITNDVIVIDKNNSDDFIKELEANPEYFKPNEVYSVTYGDSIVVYGTLRLENILGFNITTSSSLQNFIIKLDKNPSDPWTVDYHALLTTPMAGSTVVSLDGCKFRYGDKEYIPYGSGQTGDKTYLWVADGNPVPVTCYRDALLSALERVYGDTSDLVSYIEEDVVIQRKSGLPECIYYDDGDGFITGVSESLEPIVTDISYIATEVSNGEWTSLKDVTADTNVGPIEKLKYNIVCQLKNVEKGYITVCVATNRGTSEDPDLLYTRYLFWFGYGSNVGAIEAYNEEHGTSIIASNFTPVQIESPNAANLGPNAFIRMACASPAFEERLVVDPASDFQGDFKCSTVSTLEIYPPAVETGYDGYLYDYNSVLDKNEQTRFSNSIGLQENNMTLSREDGTYWAIIENYVYYNRELPSTNVDGKQPVILSTEALTPDEFIKLLKMEIVNNYSTCANLSSGNVIVGAKIDTNSESCNADEEYGSNQKIFSIEVVNGIQSTSAQFALVQKFTSSKALSKFHIEQDTSIQKYVVFTLDTTYAFTEHTDTISFDPSAIDGNGSNVYYDKFNYLDRDFHIELLNEEGDITAPFTSDAFGNEVTPRKSNLTDFIDAFNDLEDLEFKPDFIFDAGLSNPTFYKSVTDFAENYAHAMVPAAIPAVTIKSGRRHLETTEEALEFKGSIGNSTNRFVVGPSGWQRDTVFGDISFECSPAYYYLQKVLSNTNAVTAEFQPIFWKMQGRIETSDPVIGMTTKADRERLLDVNVNSIIKDRDNNYSYLNGNYTDQVETSVFSEEQNVRINNKIAHICDTYIDLNVMAKNHTAPLRKRTQDALSNQIRENVIDGRGEDTLTSFRVVVDDTNNPDFGRRIRVDVYATYGESINEALVYTRTEQLVGNG